MNSSGGIVCVYKSGGGEKVTKEEGKGVLRPLDNRARDNEDSRECEKECDRAATTETVEI